MSGGLGPMALPGPQPCPCPLVWGSDRRGRTQEPTDRLGPGAEGRRLPLPRAAEEKASPPQGPPPCPNPQGPASSPSGCGGKALTTHLGAGAGVAQEVGAGDQAVPEAATPTAPHTAVAAGDRDTGGRRARGDGSGHLGSRAAGGSLVCRLPARPAQHGAGAQVVLSGVPRAAAVGALRRKTRLRRDTVSPGLHAQAQHPALRSCTHRRRAGGRVLCSEPDRREGPGWEEGTMWQGRGSGRLGDRELELWLDSVPATRSLRGRGERASL